MRGRSSTAFLRAATLNDVTISPSRCWQSVGSGSIDMLLASSDDRSRMSLIKRSSVSLLMSMDSIACCCSSFVRKPSFIICE